MVGSMVASSVVRSDIHSVGQLESSKAEMLDCPSAGMLVHPTVDPMASTMADLLEVLSVGLMDDDSVGL